MSAMTDKAALSPRRSSPMGVEDDKIADAVVRMTRALGRRVAAGDPDAAVLFERLDGELRQAWSVAVAGWRSSGFSDGEIGAPLGITKQAVQQRWPRQHPDPRSTA